MNDKIDNASGATSDDALAEPAHALSAAPPAWFERAVSEPRESHHADSLGCSIHYVSWNGADTSKPPLLFVHGMLGHTHWWDFIAPFFTDRYRVYALDLSGMGATAHRASYEYSLFANDIAAVIGAIGAGAATVVGHSFGGSRLLEACAQFPALIEHAVVIDSYYGPDESDRRASNTRRPGNPRPYADRALALSRFTLVPDQEALPWLLDYVATHSLEHRSDGWSWRFDPNVRLTPRHATTMETLSKLQMPVDYVYGGASLVADKEFAKRLVAALPNGRGPVEVPCTGHHIMLEQPLALVSVLNALLAGPIR